MLKGHAKIELTDVNTGEKEIIEHDNLVTNAVLTNLEFMSKFRGASEINNSSTSTINNTMLPLWDNAMGGILLFNNELEEDVNNVSLPNNIENPLIGYASNSTTDSTDTKRGLKDPNNSSKTTNGYKYVWNFNQNQANGTISAIALTSTTCGDGAYQHRKGCFYYETLKYYNQNSLFYNTNVVDFDFETGVFTEIIPNSENTIDIYTFRVPYNRVGIKTSLLNIELISTQNIVLTLPDGVTDIKKYIWVKGDDGYYYAFYASNSSTINCLKTDLFSSSMTIDKLTLPTVNGIQPKITMQTPGNYSTQKNVVVSGNNIYVCTTKELYIFPINGSSSGKRISLTGADTETKLDTATTSSMISMFNGDLYGNSYVILSPADSSREIISRGETTFNGSSTTLTNLFIRDDGCYCGFFYGSTNSSDVMCFGSTFQYLATINNLGTPVTKTSAKTMTITYTLTETE